MSPRRRPLLLSPLALLLPEPAAAASTATNVDVPRRGRTLSFPRDHGAHPGARTEWWYATGWLQRAGEAVPTLGFQVTFFRSRTDLAAGLPGRLAPRQLLFAHAAITDLTAQRHRHAQRIARWNGEAGDGAVFAARADTAVRLGRWQLMRREAAGATVYDAELDDASAGLGLRLALTATQPLLLQGEAGWSRKGPDAADASHYYSQPQLAVSGQVRLDGRDTAVTGRAWLDHEWSEQVLPAQARGWDWIGMNLLDGSALTAFRLRREDGTSLWAGGSHRSADGRLTVFAPDELRFEPLAHWASGDSGARYPVRWRVHTPAGAFEVRALLDAQELDSRGSTGAVYWEGVSELRDGGGRRVGLGYLEMTGYAGRLRL